MAISQIKTNELSLLLMILLCVAPLLVTGCATVTGDWNNTRQENTIVTYQRFLGKYPDSEFTQEAKQQIERLRYQEALEKDQVALYINFMRDYPESSHIPEIRRRLDVKRLALRQLPPIKSVTIELSFVAQGTRPEQSIVDFLLDSLQRKGLTVLTDKTKTADIRISIGEIQGMIPAGSNGIYTITGQTAQLTGGNAFYQIPVSIHHRTAGPIYIEKTVESDTMYGPMWGGEVQTKRVNSLNQKIIEEISEVLKTYFLLR